MREALDDRRRPGRAGLPGGERGEPQASGGMLRPPTRARLTRSASYSVGNNLGVAPRCRCCLPTVGDGGSGSKRCTRAEALFAGAGSRPAAHLPSGGGLPGREARGGRLCAGPRQRPRLPGPSTPSSRPRGVDPSRQGTVPPGHGRARLRSSTVTRWTPSSPARAHRTRLVVH